ncbi:MAG: hypothetical protein LBR74_08695 [Eubacterium sp.]|jgi:hypothetical protein|nr:hypothetical protein [Eubacterium sp.]
MTNNIKKSILCFAAILVFCGCDGAIVMNSANLNLDKAYSFSAELVYGDLKAAGNFERFSGGRWNVELTEPYELQGMSLFFKDGKAKATFHGITVDITGLPEISTVADKVINTVENAISSEGSEARRSGDIIKVTGISDYGAYTLELDAKTKLPISASLPDHNLELTFSNVSVSEITEPDVIDNG